MCEFYTKITIAQLLRLPLFMQSQKFTPLDDVIYNQVIPSFWK